MKVLRQVRSYTTLFSYQQRQENKAKLACLASDTNFDFVHNFVYILQYVPSPATAPKMLVGAYQRQHRETAMMPADANWVGRYFMNHEYIRKRTEYYCSIFPESIPRCHLYFRREGSDEGV